MVLYVDIADDLNEGEKNDEGKKTLVFILERFLPAETQVRPAPFLKIGDEGRCPVGPYQIGIAEFFPEIFFLRKHDSFIIQPENKADNQGDPPQVKEQGKTQPHDEVPKVQRMPYQGVHPRSIEKIGDLPVGVGARGSLRRMADGENANPDSTAGNQQTDDFPQVIQMLASPGNSKYPVPRMTIAIIKIGR